MPPGALQLRARNATDTIVSAGRVCQLGFIELVEQWVRDGKPFPPRHLFITTCAPAQKQCCDGGGSAAQSKTVHWPRDTQLGEDAPPLRPRKRCSGAGSAADLGLSNLLRLQRFPTIPRWP